MKVYGHSSLFYWWPVWLAGFIMAGLTYAYGVQVSVSGGEAELVLPSRIPGVIFTAVLILVIIFTNITLRGMASIILILSIVLISVLVAYFNLWDDILSWLPNLSVHMNLGFYLFISSVLFVLWLLSTFVYDRLEYWLIKPGQITKEYVIGGAEKSYDTRGMVF